MAIYNKSYVWTTLADHVSRSDQEIYSLCGVKLVFLDETTYGIIRNIWVPNPDEAQQSTPTSAVGHKKPAKKTCWESGRGRTSTSKKSEPKPKREKRSRTLSESSQVTFGITPPPAIARTVRSNRQNIDYLTLNDGLEDDEVSSPKHRHRMTYRPCSGPSATRQVACKHKASLELQGVTMTGASSTLPAIPPPASKQADEPTGIPNKTDDHILPDLVLEQEDPDTTQAVSTEEEMDAAAALLSLGEIRDNTLDNNNENAELMPIGGPNVPVDIAPLPIRLDQLNVGNAFTEMIQLDDQSKNTLANKKTEEQADVQAVAKSDDANKVNTINDKNKQELSTKGTLRTKTYSLKKKTGTKCRSFKCSECDVIKKSI